ncbi:hypothetical protein ES703_85607 [subsurface metagenome]
MSSTFLTQRGYKAFLVLSGCAGLAAFFMDYFLAALALGIAGFIFYDYKKAKKAARKLNELVKLNLDKVKIVSVAGESKTVRLSCEVDTNLSMNLLSPLKEAKLIPERLKKGKHNLEFLLSSEISGSYRSDKIKAEIFGPYKLGRKEGSIPFNLEFKVFPRVMVALVQAALFLLEGGREVEGEVPISLKGPGTEYAGTREYISGDRLHHIDWKGTARHRRLMVKEFFLEAGQGAHIIYDIRATGPVSQDRLATSFLNTCLGGVEQGYPLGLTVHDGEEVLLHSNGENPRQMLKMAIRYVLRSMKAHLEDADILIDAFSSSQIRRFLNKVKEEPVKRVLEFEVKAIKDRLKKPHRFLVQLSYEMDEPKQFLLISQLSDEVIEILELVDEIQKHHRLIIIQPTECWREAENLEEAYRWHQRIEKVEKILVEHKVEIRALGK